MTPSSPMGLDRAPTNSFKGLADRKSDIATGVANINTAARSVADLLTVAREPIKQFVQQTDRVAGQIMADHDYVDELVRILPAYQILSSTLDCTATTSASTSATHCSSSTGRAANRCTSKWPARIPGRCTPR